MVRSLAHRTLPPCIEPLFLGLLLQICCGERALVNPGVPSKPSLEVFLARAEMATLHRRLERRRSTDFQRRQVQRIEEPRLLASYLVVDRRPGLGAEEPGYVAVVRFT